MSSPRLPDCADTHCNAGPAGPDALQRSWDRVADHGEAVPPSSVQTHVPAGSAQARRRPAALLAAGALAVPAAVGVLAPGWDVPTRAPVAVLAALALALGYLGIRARVRRALAEVDRQLHLVELRRDAATDPPALMVPPSVGAGVDPAAAGELRCATVSGARSRSGTCTRSPC